MENPIKMDDLGVPLFLETPISHLQKLGKSSTQVGAGWDRGYVIVPWRLDLFGDPRLPF